MTLTLHTICTAKDSEYRLTGLPARPFAAGTALPEAPIILEPRVRYQKHLGFGGAFTEAAAVTLNRLSAARRQEFLQAYFNPEVGHGYTLCRTHINSCDFSLGNYAYDETPDDTALEHFSLAHDEEAIFPLIREARAVAGPDFQLFASPWSPPAWMKTNGTMNRGGQLKPEYRAVWADYYCKYIEGARAAGIPVWGISVQNEPLAVQTWDSCIFTGEEERDFVRDYLGPALHRHGFPEINIIIWDHNRDLLYERAKAVLDDPAAARYVWGVGFHWYGPDCFDNVRHVHDAFPDKQLIFTEGCVENGPHIDAWETGERYARSIINDLNRWTVAWVDWNLLLDEQGGPNHVGNYCSAPILADPANDRLLYQSSFYYIGHFSRFIRPGAERILCSSARDELETTAFRNPDGRIVVVILNRTEKAIPFALKCEGHSAALEIPARAILTCSIEKGN